jgi:hypothetical protein
MASVQGFESQMQQGTVVLFSGEHPGAGKRTAAEALGPFSSPFADSSLARRPHIAHRTTRTTRAPHAIIPKRKRWWFSRPSH